ncbi:hypothetical protein [Leifsonia poae]|uniref:MFS transporter permease n=1 Tax=Leifsonia poae TaxID=110933 RepID=A0A9W6M1C1_9MICO|nr:hypothetical protein [Leifsonia poae]GLJ77775.1 hypothetical protein GCM10017584_33490 [Leifsonia poae]
MFIRKAFYWWLFPSAVVLPVWLLIGWAIFHPSGWAFVALLVICPILFIAQLAIGGIIAARRSVRESRAVSWYDVGLLTAWHASIVVFGCFIDGVSSWLPVVGILLGLATFWIVLWELVTETRTRVQQTFEAYERAAQPQQVNRPPAASGDAVEYIVIEERRDES